MKEFPIGTRVKVVRGIDPTAQGTSSMMSRRVAKSIGISPGAVGKLGTVTSTLEPVGELHPTLSRLYPHLVGCFGAERRFR